VTLRKFNRYWLALPDLRETDLLMLTLPAAESANMKTVSPGDAALTHA
jgi:hypothetical protein